MNSPVSIAPTNVGQDGFGERQIYIRLSIPQCAEWFYPAANRIATVLLRDLLDARIQQAGVSVTEKSSVGELSHALFQFTVSKFSEALAAIKDELERQHLLWVAQIAWHDPREGVFRTWYPDSGQRFDIPTDLIETEHQFLAWLTAEVESDRQLYAKLAEFLKKHLPPQDGQATP